MLTNIFGIIIVLFAIWLCFEVWRAPLMRENEDGSWTTIKPTKKLKDLFKKKK
jgi:ABC-type nickel/cobalt efflux system permease component RcnA